ncbi:KilA-N domain-containing protein [Cryomorpha ignava]
MKKNVEIIVQGFTIKTFKSNFGDYISLTAIARNKNANEPKDVVKNWMRSKSTIEFLGLWEQINNTSFKGVEFDSFKNEAGSNAFTLSPSKWIENTNAIGIISKQGKNGGTYAHKNIAFEFAP